MDTNLTELPKWRLERILRIGNVPGRSLCKKRSHLIYRCKQHFNQKRKRLDTSEENPEEIQNFTFNLSELPNHIVENEIVPHMTNESLLQFARLTKPHSHMVKRLLHKRQITIDMILSKNVLSKIQIQIQTFGPAMYPLDSERLITLLRDIFRLDLKIDTLTNLDGLILSPDSKVKWRILVCTMKCISNFQDYILIHDKNSKLDKIRKYLIERYGIVTNIKLCHRYSFLHRNSYFFL